MFVATIAGLTLIGAACAGSDDERSIESLADDTDVKGSDAAPEPEPEPEPESDPEPDPAPEPELDDPFAFDDPSEIDEAYVDAVMAALLTVHNEVLLETLTSDPDENLTQDQLDRIRALNSGPSLVSVADRFERNATIAEVREAFQPPEDFTGVTWETGIVLHAADDCIAAIGFADTTGTASEPPDPDRYMVLSLSPLSDDQREEFAGINDTGWRQNQLIELIYTDSGDYVPREAWMELEFDDVQDVEEFAFTCGQGTA